MKKSLKQSHRSTENNIKDPHFSWLGHKDMSEYIIDLITKDKHIGKKVYFNLDN